MGFYFKKNILLFFCTLLLGACVNLRKSSQSGVIFVAKEVLTVEDNMPMAEAVAVKDGKIVGVGSEKDIREAFFKKGYVIDQKFKNYTLVPGLIDQHLHPLLAAITMKTEIVSIEDWVHPDKVYKAIRTRAGYIKRIQELVKSKPNNELFLTWGYHHYFHGKIRKKDLDKISSSVPIVLWHRSGHELIFNTAALKKFNIQKTEIQSLPVHFQKQINFSEGHFYERGCFDYALLKIFPYIASPEKANEALVFVEKYLHTNGVTLSAEPGGMIDKASYDQQNNVFSDEKTPFKFYFMPHAGYLDAKYKTDQAILEAANIMNHWGKGRTAFLPKQIKLFADGAIFSQLMQMRRGYTDGHHGEWMMPPKQFKRLFKLFWDAGYQIHIHQNGDLGLEMVLNTLEENLKRNPRRDHRTTIVHFGFAASTEIKRIKRLGAIISANPYYTIALSDKYGQVGVGFNRADNMVPLGEAYKEDIPLSLHSDMPMAPSQPLFLMWSAVNRQTFSGRIPRPDQRISAEAALKAVTLGAAYSLRLEDKVGSIKVGKDANFTILEENPLKVNPSRIKDIGVVGTVLEGQWFPVKSSNKRE